MIEYPEKKGVICAVCGKGFTDREWEERHSEGLDEYHRKHCLKCEPDKAFFVELHAREKVTK